MPNASEVAARNPSLRLIQDRLYQAANSGNRSAFAEAMQDYWQETYISGGKALANQVASIREYLRDAGYLIDVAQRTILKLSEADLAIIKASLAKAPTRSESLPTHAPLPYEPKPPSKFAPKLPYKGSRRISLIHDGKSAGIFPNARAACEALGIPAGKSAIASLASAGYLPQRLKDLPK